MLVATIAIRRRRFRVMVLNVKLISFLCFFVFLLLSMLSSDLECWENTCIGTSTNK
jgi:hypothetical protein